MRMRARNYSVLNRSIARGITYALRDSNMRKYKTNSNIYPNINNNTVKMPQINSTEGNDTVIIWIIVISFIFLGLMCIFPRLMILFFLLFVLLCLFC